MRPDPVEPEQDAAFKRHHRFYAARLARWYPPRPFGAARQRGLGGGERASPAAPFEEAGAPLA